MKAINAVAKGQERMSAAAMVDREQKYATYPAYVGLDVHKDTVSVAVVRSLGMEQAGWFVLGEPPRTTTQGGTAVSRW